MPNPYRRINQNHRQHGGGEWTEARLDSPLTWQVVARFLASPTPSTLPESVRPLESSSVTNLGNKGDVIVYPPSAWGVRRRGTLSSIHTPLLKSAKPLLSFLYDPGESRKSETAFRPYQARCRPRAIRQKTFPLNSLERPASGRRKFSPVIGSSLFQYPHRRLRRRLIDSRRKALIVAQPDRVQRQSDFIRSLSYFTLLLGDFSAERSPAERLEGETRSAPRPPFGAGCRTTADCAECS